jgi:GT2 family glycosyltransferase
VFKVNKIDSIIFEIFDELYYLKVYPDVRDANIDALEHFMEFGRYERRSPNAIFDSTWYQDQVGSLKGLDPLSHYLSIGSEQGLDPNPFFDSEWYRSKYLLHDKKSIPLVHYFINGYKLGYDPNPFFDVDWYALEYDSSHDYHRDPLSDFILNENAELRNPNATFNTKDYLEFNPDLSSVKAKAFEIALHFFKHGLNEDRPPQDKNNFSKTYLFPRSATESKMPVRTGATALVIPVFNNWYATERCLRSIFRTKDSYALDVFLLNDSSTDSTVNEISRFPRVRVITTPQNLGFTKACNYAFKQLVDYQFVYLLNNDTEVFDGFVENGMQIMAERPLAGIVGSTLINPDMTIQECGGLIWSDGSGLNFGRGEKMNDLKFSFSRQVDYCSGAGILLRNEYLKLVDFFDESFAPAYYEDTDLAFKMRANGFEVWVSSGSKVLHFEGLSHGTDASVGVKASQITNQKRFFNKWKEVLGGHFQSTSNREDILKAAMHRVEFGEKILVWVDDLYPDPSRDSGSVRATELLRMSLDFFSMLIFSPIYENRVPSDMEQRRNLGQIISKDIDAILFFLGSLGHIIDTAWLSRVTSAFPTLLSIRAHSPEAKIIFDTVDLHHLRITRELELHESSMDPYQNSLLKNKEELLIQLADTTLMVSEFEKELYRNTDFFPKIRILSNVHQSAVTVPTFEQTKGLVFIGGFSHTPNISGIKWFVNKVWPLVTQEIRDDGLTICGSNMPQEVYELAGNGVSAIGWVEDADKEIGKHRISVAPLLVGAGVKGKVGQAMAIGVPVIATPIAVEGMGVTAGVEVIVAESPEQFAKSINDLYGSKSLWTQTPDSAQTLITEKYSNTAARQVLESLFT